MAVVNQYKFVGIDNSTSGAALTPLGASAAPLVLLSIPTNLYWFR